ncbi:hypothetical protein Tco_0215651 [Tanacetum coccineum]
MDNPNITIEEYIRLEEEKTHRRGKVYNWEIATYGKIWDNEDVHNLGSVKTEFPAIVSIWRILGYGYGVSTSCTVLGPREGKSTNVGGEFTNMEILKCWSLENSRRLFNTNS